MGSRRSTAIDLPLSRRGTDQRAALCDGVFRQRAARLGSTTAPASPVVRAFQTFAAKHAGLAGRTTGLRSAAMSGPSRRSSRRRSRPRLPLSATISNRRAQMAYRTASRSSWRAAISRSRASRACSNSLACRCFILAICSSARKSAICSRSCPIDAERGGIGLVRVAQFAGVRRVKGRRAWRSFNGPKRTIVRIIDALQHVAEIRGPDAQGQAGLALLAHSARRRRTQQRRLGRF